jgi:hypothetical protein
LTSRLRREGDHVIPVKPSALLECGFDANEKVQEAAQSTTAAEKRTCIGRSLQATT